MTIYEEIVVLLKSLGYNEVRQQGDFDETEELPVKFATYQIIDSSYTGYYSNKKTWKRYRIQINVYSKNQAEVQTAEKTLDDVFLDNKFHKIAGRDLPLWKASQHYGYSIDYRKYKLEE